MAVAIANLSAGDVILLEQQWWYDGPGPEPRQYIPIEWWLNYSPNPQTFNGVYAAIINAVSNGIHVVEAGGNGNVNTDLLTWFGNSGAIIVGAGGAYPGGTWPEGDLQRLSFSSYGSRFDLQGWGEDVVTTGYGNLYNVEGVNLYYTNTFSGTSSASPIVAGAVACCVAFYKANKVTPPYPTRLRTILKDTGTPQVIPPTGNIGPRPNLRAAFPVVSPPIPTLTEWGLIILVALLVFSTWVILRRRKVIGVR
jgi:subtilisin family serine protease